MLLPVNSVSCEVTEPFRHSQLFHMFFIQALAPPCLVMLLGEVDESNGRAEIMMMVRWRKRLNEGKGHNTWSQTISQRIVGQAYTLTLLPVPKYVMSVMTLLYTFLMASFDMDPVRSAPRNMASKQHSFKGLPE
jgi:hypothetical protein